MDNKQGAEYLADLEKRVREMTFSELEEQYAALMFRHEEATGEFRRACEADGPLSGEWFVAQHQVYYRRIQFLKTGVDVRPDGGCVVVAMSG